MTLKFIGQKFLPAAHPGRGIVAFYNNSRLHFTSLLKSETVSMYCEHIVVIHNI